MKINPEQALASTRPHVDAVIVGILHFGREHRVAAVGRHLFVGSEKARQEPFQVAQQDPGIAVFHHLLRQLAEPLGAFVALVLL